MHFITASMSVFAFGFFLGANACQETRTKPDGTIVTFACGEFPADSTSTQTETRTPTAPQSILTGGPDTPHDTPDGCLITVTKSGTATVLNTCNPGLSISETITTAAPTHTSISPHQLNVACWTTLTKDGQVVVVSCGNGFVSGHPPTATTPAVTSAPSTICVEDRCFEVIGTFGSAASTTAAPTPTHDKSEL